MSKPVLIIAAHADDETIGCGGTIARHAEEGDAVKVLIVADGESSRRGRRSSKLLAQRKAAGEKACAILGVQEIKQLGLPDNQLDTLPLLSIVKEIETLIEEFKPTIVYTHHSGDVNIDHQIVHEATLVATRPQPDITVESLYFFEILSSTDYRPAASRTLFSPNYFVDVEKFISKKFEALNAYSNEMRLFPHSRSREAIDAQLKLRGAMVGLMAAEAFEVGRHIRRKDN